MLFRYAIAAALFAMLSPLVMTVGCGSGSSTPQPTATPVPGFRFTALAGDIAGAALHTDSKLINPWGLAFMSSGPFIIANNGTNTFTGYEDDGRPIPTSIETGGGPTGMEINRTGDFKLADGNRAMVLFATEAGTLNGWNTSATEVAADRSASGAVYKGLAVASSGNQNFLFTTDFHNGRIDRFDGSFRLLNSFTDPNIPAGFAPFGIQTINNLLYVTYAKQKRPDNRDDDPSDGNGFLDVFRPDGTLVKRLVSGGPLNSPWGIALAPEGFGLFADKLLVGNLGNGRINAFDPNTGAFVGEMQENNDHPMIVPGLRTISFGNGGSVRRVDTLYLTAGPEDETHGLFGTISVH
jgi:uncharacterized protein (TIGR03118 family)